MRIKGKKSWYLLLNLLDYIIVILSSLILFQSSYNNTKFNYFLFQNISANLLNEIKAFRDIASEQHSRLEVRQLLVSPAMFCSHWFSSNRKLFLNLSYSKKTGNPNSNERTLKISGTDDKREGDVFPGKYWNGKGPEGSRNTPVVNKKRLHFCILIIIDICLSVLF